MDPFVANLVAALWAGVSGFLLSGLGVLAMRGRNSRPWGAFAFGGFLLIWGAQIVAGNAASLATDPAVATRLHLVSTALLLPLPFLLLSFAVGQFGAGRGAWEVLPKAAALLAALLAAVLFVAPDMLFAGVVSGSFTLQPLWGPLYLPAVLLPFFASFGAALVALAVATRDAPTRRTAVRFALLYAGLAVYVAFLAGRSASFYGLWALLYGGTTTTFLLAATFVAVAAAAFASVAIVLRARAMRHSRRDRGILLAVVALPFAYGLLEGYLRLQVMPLLDTLGLWRAAGAVSVAYGLMRWRTPDLDARAKRWGASGAGIAGAAAGAATTYGFVSLALPGIFLPLAVSGVAGAAIAAPAVRAVRRWFGAASPAAADSDAAYGERIESYRAALEASIARGTLDEDGPFLSALRERFGIGEEAHRVLLHYARSAVIVARDGDVEGAYERLRLLGEGGAGRTWLARDRVRDQLVVLKEPLAQFHEDPLIIANATREARLAARVRHPNVVRVHEVITHQGRPILVMEYVEGGSLAHLLRARGRLPVQDAVRLAVEVLDGLAAVHAAGVVHRDIKPSNVLLSRDGVAKIADFGIAVSAGSGQTVVLSDGAPTTSRAGTLTYMAPEVLSGASTGDARADVYACAALLHECLTGAPPSVLTAPRLDASVPPAVRDAIARGLDPDPARRHATARAFRDALERTVVA